MTSARNSCLGSRTSARNGASSVSAPRPAPTCRPTRITTAASTSAPEAPMERSAAARMPSRSTTSPAVRNKEFEVVPGTPRHQDGKHYLISLARLFARTASRTVKCFFVPRLSGNSQLCCQGTDESTSPTTQGTTFICTTPEGNGDNISNNFNDGTVSDLDFEGFGETFLTVSCPVHPVVCVS
ncbi:unnamed protein product [Ectocarpus fasciculatus]